MKRILLAFAYLSCCTAAEATNYYQVLALDQETVLCDSRASCADYSEGIEVLGVEPWVAWAFEPGSVSVLAVRPMSFINDRTDVYIRHHASYTKTIDLGFYKYVGGPPGAAFSPLYSNAGELETESTLGSYSYDLHLPFPHPLDDPDSRPGEALGSGVFGQSFHMKARFSVEYDLYIRPSFGCTTCMGDIFIGTSNFTGSGYLNDVRLEGLQLVPADIPEPSTYMSFTSGFVAMIILRRRQIRVR